MQVVHLGKVSEMEAAIRVILLDPPGTKMVGIFLSNQL